jgi:Bifunctional DNA primase/polymerase, N-terminal
MDLIEWSLRLERRFHRPPLIRCRRDNSAVDKDWPRAPFDDPDGWRPRLSGWTENVGMVMGRGLLCVDADIYKPGAQGAFDALVDSCGLDLCTAVQLSGGGGHHYFYSYNPGLTVPSKSLESAGYPGIDIKADGGYVIVEPSVSPKTGRAYVFEGATW